MAASLRTPLKYPNKNLSGARVGKQGKEREGGGDSGLYEKLSRLISHRKSSDDAWVSNGTYLELRKDLGFSRLDHPVLW